MDLRRTCIHEAGHFYVAFMYRPSRAVGICISKQARIDPLTGEEYVSGGHVVTFDPLDSLPKVQVSIRAAGIAAESLIYNESLDDLMTDRKVQFRIKTDTDNAKQDLATAGLRTSTEEEFLSFWSAAFYDALGLLRSSRDKLERIADYCLANLGREIPRSELVKSCDL